MVEPVISRTVRTRLIGSIFVTQALFRLAVFLSFLLTPIIATELTGEKWTAGFPTFVSLIFRALLGYPVGWLLDKMGRRIGLSLGFFVGILASIISAWAIINGSFVGFLFGAALYGGTQASSEQGRYVAAEIFPRAQQAKIIGWVIFAGTVVVLLGPPLAEWSTVFAESRGLVASSGLFLLSAIIFLFATIIIFVFLRPDPQKLGQKIAAEEITDASNQPDETVTQEVDKSENEATTTNAWRIIFNSPPALLAVAAMTLGQLVMVMLMVITSLYMRLQGSGVGDISVVIAVHVFGMFGLSGLTGWLITRFGRLHVISAGAFILILSSIMAPSVSGVVLLALALFLLGLGWNFAFVAGSSLLSNQLKPADRGRVQGAGETSVAIGAGLGTLGSPFIFAWGGILAVSIVGLGFSLALLGLVFWYRLSAGTEGVLAAGQD